MKAILDEAADAVLFSFGSIADTRKMGPAMRRAFLDAFARFPEVEFIWKFARNETTSSIFAVTAAEETLLSGAAPPNVHTFDWVDQKAILGKRLKIGRTN